MKVRRGTEERRAKEGSWLIQAWIEKEKREEGERTDTISSCTVKRMERKKKGEERWCATRCSSNASNLI